MTTNWREMLIEAFNETGDNFTELQTTLTDDELVKFFDDESVGREGLHFTAWGEKYVYFPVVYEGLEWVGYAPRNPCDVKTTHWGGG